MSGDSSPAVVRGAGPAGSGRGTVAVRHVPLAAVAAVALAAIALGAAVALDAAVAAALVAAGAFAAVLWFDLRLAIVLWVPLVWLDAVGPANTAAKAAGGLVLLGWFAIWPRLRSQRSLREAGWVPIVLAVLVAWLSLTLTWSVDLAGTTGVLWQWYAVAGVFVIVVTAMARRRPLRLLAGAYVVGALLSILVGVLLPDLAAGAEGRFQGAIGDPNLLAAGLVPAAVLAIGLAAGQRDRRWWAAAAVAVVVLAGTLVASGSRGGLVGAAAAVVAAPLVAGRRWRLGRAAGVAALVAVGAALVAFPGTWERSSEVGPGSGRADLWRVAWHMAADAPVTGVGLGAFPQFAGDYVRAVGPLQAVDLIAVEPHDVHNMYLQMVAETGVVGLGLFVAVIGGCLGAAWRAARRFGDRGDRTHAALATAVVLAMVAFLVSGAFISHAVDRRLWVLLAMGPALLVATRIDTDR